MSTTKTKRCPHISGTIRIKTETGEFRDEIFPAPCIGKHCMFWEPNAPTINGAEGEKGECSKKLADYATINLTNIMMHQVQLLSELVSPEEESEEEEEPKSSEEKTPESKPVATPQNQYKIEG